MELCVTHHAPPRNWKLPLKSPWKDSTPAAGPVVLFGAHQALLDGSTGSVSRGQFAPFALASKLVVNFLVIVKSHSNHVNGINGNGKVLF